MRVRVRLGPDPGSGILAMVGYSFAGHIVAIIVLIFAPKIIPHRPPPPLVLTAQIVSLPAGDGAEPAPKSPPSEPRVSPTEMAKKAAAEAEKRKQPERKEIPPVPDEPKPKQRPAPKKKPPAAAAVVDEKASEKSEKQAGEEEAAAPAARPAEPLTEGIGLGAGGADDGSGIPSITSESFPYQYYRTAMVNKIRSLWRRPLTPGLQGSLRCAIAFVISKDGRISDAQVSVSSGLGALDESALRAVMEATPLGPLPYQYTTPSVRAELIFELTPD